MFEFAHKNEEIFFAWSPQKISNIRCVIQVVRALVAPTGPALVSSIINE